jgi:hypothetical protein
MYNYVTSDPMHDSTEASFPLPTRERRRANLEPALERRLCRVVGRNRNHKAASGTLYHLQIEDLGPMVDRASNLQVRRVNFVIYANYGEGNAQIVYDRNYDFADIRTGAHNQYVEEQIQRILEGAPKVVEEIEKREIARIKALVREYYYTRSDSAKRGFEAANGAFPFLFSRAWRELKTEQTSAENLARRAG